MKSIHEAEKCLAERATLRARLEHDTAIAEQRRRQAEQRTQKMSAFNSDLQNKLCEGLDHGRRRIVATPQGTPADSDVLTDNLQGAASSISEYSSCQKRSAEAVSASYNATKNWSKTPSGTTSVPGRRILIDAAASELKQTILASRVKKLNREALLGRMKSLKHSQSDGG